MKKVIQKIFYGCLQHILYGYTHWDFIIWLTIAIFATLHQIPSAKVGCKLARQSLPPDKGIREQSHSGRHPEESAGRLTQDHKAGPEVDKTGELDEGEQEWRTRTAPLRHPVL